MKYLITGGAGFIGSHLAEALLRKGEEVIVIDDLSTGKMANIEHLKSEERFKYVIDTIMNKSLMAQLVDASDIVFHLAASVGVRLIIESPIKTIETNINGTEIVLRLASKKHTKVILASTSEVYGKSDKIPFSENDDLLMGPTYKNRWIYGCSKALDEFLALAYYKERQLPVVIVRLFNVVGPRQTGRYGMVLPTFIGQALNGEPITVYGDGKQSRTFAWVGDAVEAIIKLGHCSQAIGEIFNIGSKEETTIRDLAKLVRRLTKSGSEIVYVPYDEAYNEGFEDLRRRVPDISKLERQIGYEPTKRIDQVIEDIAEYSKKRKTAGKGHVN